MMKITFNYRVNNASLTVEADVQPSLVNGYVQVKSASILGGMGLLKEISQITEEDLKNAAIVHLNAFKRLHDAIAV